MRAVFRLPLVRLWPALRNPTAFSSGQSVCSGCGSEFIWCDRLSLFTNCTWLPRATVTVFGLTPLLVMVMTVAPGDGFVPVLPELPPQAAAHAAGSKEPLVRTFELLAPFLRNLHASPGA